MSVLTQTLALTLTLILTPGGSPPTMTARGKGKTLPPEKAWSPKAVFCLLSKPPLQGARQYIVVNSTARNRLQGVVVKQDIEKLFVAVLFYTAFLARVVFPTPRVVVMRILSLRQQRIFPSSRGRSCSVPLFSDSNFNSKITVPSTLHLERISQNLRNKNQRLIFDIKG